MKPRFKQVCVDCQFLGIFDREEGWTGWPRQFDLYVCRGTVIARYGDEPEENFSAPIKYAAHIEPLAEAKRIAESIEFHREPTHDGYYFKDFHARRSAPHGSGWFVFGRNNEKYGLNSSGEGAYIRMCARPIRFRSNSRRAGWRTKAEAERVAALMNATPPGALRHE